MSYKLIFRSLLYYLSNNDPTWRIAELLRQIMLTSENLFLKSPFSVFHPKLTLYLSIDCGQSATAQSAAVFGSNFKISFPRYLCSENKRIKFVNDKSENYDWIGFNQTTKFVANV